MDTNDKVFKISGYALNLIISMEGDGDGEKKKS
jgi:hypothetical protein